MQKDKHFGTPSLLLVPAVETRKPLQRNNSIYQPIRTGAAATATNREHERRWCKTLAPPPQESTICSACQCVSLSVISQQVNTAASSPPHFTYRVPSIMREIVHIQAGQCGNQIGAKVRRRRCSDNKLTTCCCCCCC